MSQIEVVVDGREPNWFKAFIELVCKNVSKSIKFSDRNLETGDVCIATDKSVRYIERKSYADFINSALNNRLFDQAFRLAELQQKGARVGIVVEGSMDYISIVPQLNWLNNDERRGRYFWSTIDSLNYRYGISTQYIPHRVKKEHGITVLDREQLRTYFHSAILREMKYSNDRLPEMTYVRMPKHHYNKDVRIQMLSVINGITTKTAGELLPRFKNFKELVNASPEDYLIPKKIGKTKSGTIHTVWNIGTDITVKRGKSK